MAITEAYSGTVSVSVTVTEHYLNTVNPETTDGIYQLFVDLNSLAAGETLEIRIKEKVISGGTERNVFTAAFSQPQSSDQVIFVSPALVLMHGWDMTIAKTVGVTGTTYPWSIRKVA